MKEASAEWNGGIKDGEGMLRESNVLSVADAFKKIPLDKIKEARDLLASLKNSE